MNDAFKRMGALYPPFAREQVQRRSTDNLPVSLFLLLIAGFALQSARSTHAQTNPVTAFVDVHVIPMDTERVLDNQTVLVEGDRIVAIGPVDDVEIPDGATRIAGEGAYLMPGLADMHTHLASYNPDPEHLVLYLAQGTTTIRSAGEAPAMLAWRERVVSDAWAGPTIYSSGRTLAGNHDNFLGFGLYMILFRVLVFLFPFLIGTVLYVAWRPFRKRRVLLIGVPSLLVVSVLLTLAKTPPFMITAPLLFPELSFGFVPESAGQAVEEVQRQAEQDVDLVKLYDGLTEDQFLAAAAAAKEQGLYVVSHLPDQIPLETLLTSGTDEIAHIDEFNSFHWIGTQEEVLDNFQRGIEPQLDDALIPQTVALMRENEVAVVSNLSADEIVYQMISDTPGVLARPAYRVVRPDILAYWRTEGRPVTSFVGQGPYRNKELSFFKTLLKSLHDAGVVVTIGTDCSALVEGTLPEQIHRELELLVEAGFTPYEALEAGTTKAAYIVNKMGRDGTFGTVETGQRADLLLLEDNPLDQVSHTRNRRGVMVRGTWYPQTALDALVEDLIARY